MKYKAVKKHRTEWPQIYEILTDGAITKYRMQARKKGYGGVKAKLFDTLSSAKEYASGIAEEVRLKGVNKAGLTTNEYYWAKKFNNEIIVKFKTSWMDIFNRELKFQEDLIKTINYGTIDNLVFEYVELRRKNKKANSLRTVNSLCNTLTRFKNKFKTFKAREVTRKMIEDYLDDDKLDLSATSKKSYLVHLSQFFKWVKTHKEQNDKNPCEGISFKSVFRQPPLIPLPIVRKLIWESRDDQDLHIYILLCLFAGLRPEEAQFVRYEYIGLEQHGKKYIFIQGDESKKRKDRWVLMTDTLTTLMAWLDSINFKGKTGPLVKRNFRKRFDNIRIKVGYKLCGKNPNGMEWDQDSMRHSFGSHMYLVNNDTNFITRNLGNDPATFEKHYRRPLPPSEGKEYFNILPNNIESQIENDRVRGDKSNQTPS